MTVAGPVQQAASGTRSKREVVLMVLLGGQLVGIGGVLPYYSWVTEDSVQLRLYSSTLLLIAVATMYALWTRRTWAPWGVLITVSMKLVVDAFVWAEELDRTFIPPSTTLNGAIIVLTFVTYVYPSGPTVTRGMKIFFASVLLLAGLIGYWGFLRPARADVVLPFPVPPLHARFLGAMYLSGATFMILGIAAKRWAEVRVMVPMIAIWTGMLGLVSLLNLEIFDWGLRQTWIWWVAYVCFPLIAAWIAYQQRGRTDRADGPTMSGVLRGYLYAQGAAATILAIALFVAPGYMADRWPWDISSVLAHIYCAPFLSYGLGSLYAARQETWKEVRIPVYSTLVFTVGVLVSSFIELQLFNLGSFIDLVWFGVFTISSVALAAFATIHSLRITLQPSPSDDRKGR